jgi:hypothetical protein
VADHPGADFFAEEPLQHVLIQRKSALREDRVTELLELLHDFVVQARIVVIRASQHHDADAVFAFELVEHLAGALADARFVILQRREAGFDGAVVFGFATGPEGLPRLYIWKAKSFWSAKLRIGSMYFTLISANRLFSLVNAAFTVAGVAVTVGQALVP